MAVESSCIIWDSVNESRELADGGWCSKPNQLRMHSSHVLAFIGRISSRWKNLLALPVYNRCVGVFRKKMVDGFNSFCHFCA